MQYDVVIGLEVHAELDTKSKCFCSCANSYGDKPNTNICPICVGLPGALPILNKQAFEYTIIAGLATNCKINDVAIFERKNYFYPDLSKAYQISQLEKPICINGHINLKNGKTIRINRIHLEEDAGKLIHEGSNTLVDYNRGGVPLIELVTEPDLSSADECIEFLTTLRGLYIYSGIAKCLIEEGGMRADVNISLKPKGSEKFGTRTEMKNIMGFKSIQRAINYEIERQKELLDEGKQVVQATLKWDDEKGENFVLRTKENSEDYRYFQDPDLPVVKIPNSLVEKISKNMPPLPHELKEKFTKEYLLSEYDADVIISNIDICKMFTRLITKFNKPKVVSNWLTTEVMARIKDNDDKSIKISDENLLYIMQAVDNGKIQRLSAKDLLSKVWGNDLNAETTAKNMNIIVDISNDDILKVIEEVISGNPNVINQYLQSSDSKVLNFLVGLVMRQTKGKANAQFVMETIKKKLGE